MRTAKMIICFLLLFPTVNALAAQQVIAGKVDPRIKTVIYNERDVIVLKGHYGYSTHVVFADDETITHISAGDSLSWQIVPTGNHLFLKPREANADTNLSVLTNRRNYNFELRANEATSASDSELSFEIRFIYPDDEFQLAIEKTLAEQRQLNTEIVPGRQIQAEEINFDYSMRGSDLVAPIRVFDDGEFTFFQFPDEIPIPAIFFVDREKQESIVNYHVRGKYIVVQRIGAQFMLRSGNDITCIFNESFAQRIRPSLIPGQGQRPTTTLDSI
ncbi:MAG: P-type conjugative transfer protein VirB9 [Gammaproteobacteria bacterium]|nr:P-type conjugative transfer protein VirB9 [Gammaproteobacteria bacterium]MBL4729709.1 P-type conjugative transfer protein VirB9 [Gammaproteobacteria bacterium]